jgi:hypothetical protein
MPRPILGTSNVSSKITRQPTESLAPTRPPVQGPRLQKQLRCSRSRAYIEAMTRLDAHAHNADAAALQDLIEAIANEFPELGIDQRPLGIVQRCYLGQPYEVHICSLKGEIIEHYETYRSMPPLFERARTLALHPAYAFVEVYADALRAVSVDGTVSVTNAS